MLHTILSTLTGIAIGLSCNVFALLTITVLAALATALGCSIDWIGIADQHDGFGWREFV